MMNAREVVALFAQKKWIHDGRRVNLGWTSSLARRICSQLEGAEHTAVRTFDESEHGKELQHAI